MHIGECYITSPKYIGDYVHIYSLATILPSDIVGYIINNFWNIIDSYDINKCACKKCNVYMRQLSPYVHYRTEHDTGIKSANKT